MQSCVWGRLFAFVCHRWGIWTESSGIYVAKDPEEIGHAHLL